MQKRYFFNGLLLFVAIHLFACNNNSDDSFQSSEAEEVAVDNSQIQQALDGSEIIEKIEIIELQETQGFFVGEASKIILKGTDYIVLDRDIAKRAVVFDSVGNFKRNLVDIGCTSSN